MPDCTVYTPCFLGTAASSLNHVPLLKLCHVVFIKELTMELIKLTSLIFIVLLCKGKYSPYSCDCFNSLSAAKRLHHVGKYCGTQISYYPNSDATFQLLLLRSGDVSPNPGPSNSGHDDVSHAKHHNQRISYDRVSLHNLRPSGKTYSNLLSHEVFERVKTLGILRKRKTHRGGKGARKRQRQPESLDHQELKSFADSSRLMTLKGNHLRFGMLNARSLRNKSTEFQDYVLEHKLDIVCVCETWLTPDDDATVADLVPTGFTFKHQPRANRRGGGVGFLFRNELKMSFSPHSGFNNFEMMSASVTSNSSSMDIVVAYRPPGPQSIFSDFLDEFSTMLDERIMRPSPLVITGDLNIHLDDPSAANTRKFNDLLVAHGLLQGVRSPTHERGHILDVFMTRMIDSDMFSDLKILPGISDHAAITCHLHLKKPPKTERLMVLRNIKRY